MAASVQKVVERTGQTCRRICTCIARRKAFGTGAIIGVKPGRAATQTLRIVEYQGRVATGTCRG